QAHALARAIAEHSHQFKLASKHYGEQIISRQTVQARLADSAMWIHAWGCTLSKLDHELRTYASGIKFDRDHAAALHFMAMAQNEIHRAHQDLFKNADDSMKVAAMAALRYSDTLPNNQFAIPEASPNAQGTGKRLPQAGIKQFPGDERYRGNGHGAEDQHITTEPNSQSPNASREGAVPGIV